MDNDKVSLTITRILRQKNYVFGRLENGETAFMHKEALLDQNRWDELRVGSILYGFVAATNKGLIFTNGY
jgi:hypothetical protein